MHVFLRLVSSVALVVVDSGEVSSLQTHSTENSRCHACLVIGLPLDVSWRMDGDGWWWKDQG